MVWSLFVQSTFTPAGLVNYLRSLQLPEIMPCVTHILCVMALKVLLTVGGFEAAFVSNSIYSRRLDFHGSSQKK